MPLTESEVDDELADIANTYNRSLELVRGEYLDELETVSNRSKIVLNEETVREIAVGNVRQRYKATSRVSGDEIELQILAVGQRGRIDDWGSNDESVVYGHGLIYGPIASNGTEKTSRAMFLHRGSHLNLAEVRRKFRCQNQMRGAYSVRESTDLNGFHVCESTPETKLIEGDCRAFNEDWEECRDTLGEAFDQAELATLSQDRSAFDPESGYTHDFGADIKWIEGRVVDYYIADDRSFANYTIIDDSVTETDVKQSDIISDGQGTPGLTVWTDPASHMEYGLNTRARFYGVIRPDNEGVYQMDLAGIDPIIPMPLDTSDEPADTGVDSTEEQI